MVEFQNFGWNLLTFSSIATGIFVLLGCWGLWQQKKSVWDNKSGKSISNTWFICSYFMFLSALIYGLSINSLALSFSGSMRSVFHIPVLIGLWRFKGFTFKQWILVVFLTIVVITMVMVPEEMIGMLFLIFTSTALIPTALQPWKIWKKRDPGVVSVKMFLVYITSSMFWIVYSSLIWDIPLMIFSVVSFTIFFITIALWFKYSDKTSKIY